MGVVFYRRLSTQRLIITNAATPFQTRKTRLSGTCHPIFSLSYSYAIDEGLALSFPANLNTIR
jgi:hypothetical protein